jgi:FAD/FMN-containing dehydrogenase
LAPVSLLLENSKYSRSGTRFEIVTRLQAPFAVHSGGHSPNPSFGSIDPGILIDLSSLNDIVLSPDHRVMSVGPGAKWEMIYEELEKHELTVAGGRATGVGVGGLITGGKGLHMAYFHHL